VERLRTRLQPLVDAGEAAPGGVVGLEWLAAAAAERLIEREEREEEAASAHATRLLEAAVNTDAQVAEIQIANQSSAKWSDTRRL
jgi:hypothetical protein